MDDFLNEKMNRKNFLKYTTFVGLFGFFSACNTDDSDKTQTRDLKNQTNTHTEQEKTKDKPSTKDNLDNEAISQDEEIENSEVTETGSQREAREYREHIQRCFEQAKHFMLSYIQSTMYKQKLSHEYKVEKKYPDNYELSLFDKTLINQKIHSRLYKVKDVNTFSVMSAEYVQDNPSHCMFYTSVPDEQSNKLKAVYKKYNLLAGNIYVDADKYKNENDEMIISSFIHELTHYASDGNAGLLVTTRDMLRSKFTDPKEKYYDNPTEINAGYTELIYFIYTHRTKIGCNPLMQEFSLEHYNNMIALPAYELAIHVRQYIDSYLKSKNNIAKDIIDIINSVADGSIDEKIDQWS